MSGCEYERGIVSDVLSHRPQDGAGHGQVSKEPLRKTEAVDEVPVPFPSSRLQQTRCAGVGVLLHLDSGESEGKVVRNEEQTLRLLEHVRILRLLRQQLVDSVELLVLDAGAPVQLLTRHGACDLVCPAVPVCHGRCQQSVLGVEQHVVHRPGVDGDVVRSSGLPQSCHHFAVEHLDVPAQVTVDDALGVLEAVDDLGDDASVL